MSHLVFFCFFVVEGIVAHTINLISYMIVLSTLIKKFFFFLKNPMNNPLYNKNAF